MSIINAGEVYHVDASKYLRGYEEGRITSINASAGTGIHTQERMQQSAKEEDTGVPVATGEECNGWKNYETWQVYCRISDDTALMEELKPLIDSRKVADALQEYVEELLEAMTPYAGLAHDLAMAASTRVDYRAIALFLLDEARLEKEQMI